MEKLFGTAADPTANTDVRHEFSLTANTTSVGFAGANNDITENKFQEIHLSLWNFQMLLEPLR